MRKKKQMYLSDVRMRTAQVLTFFANELHSNRIRRPFGGDELRRAKKCASRVIPSATSNRIEFLIFSLAAIGRLVLRSRVCARENQQKWDKNTIRDTMEVNLHVRC